MRSGRPQGQMLHELTYTWNLRVKLVDAGRLDRWFPGAGGGADGEVRSKGAQRRLRRTSDVWRCDAQQGSSRQPRSIGCLKFAEKVHLENPRPTPESENPMRRWTWKQFECGHRSTRFLRGLEWVLPHRSRCLRSPPPKEVGRVKRTGVLGRGHPGLAQSGLASTRQAP